MCGIAGIIWQDRARPGDADAARAMARAIAHRGPDGEGVEVVGPAALAHRRLSIIDLSPAGRQPMTNEDGTVWVVFNGEVYEFEELRAELEGRGHVFRSRTDTEVIVHLWEEVGPELVHRLRGMFALAIWDARRGELFLARDRAGKKPLHYRVDPDALRFASEPAALLADPSAPRASADRVAIHHYLHYGYVPSPLSAFAGASKLPPAHRLLWRPGEAPRIERWWHPSFKDKLDASTPRARRALEDELEARLEEAVRLRLVSDVPVGAFLSGGIDSGMVVATMARLRPDPVRTFTIGFESAAYDERDNARAVAARWRTLHRERVVPADAVSLLPTLVRHYGEPFADSSAIPTWRLAALAREDVTVALSGDAGDEVFAGYLRHSANELARAWRVIPRPALRLLGAIAERLPGKTTGPGDPRRRIVRFVRGVQKDFATRNAEWGLFIKPDTARTIYAPAFARDMAGIDPLDVYRAHYAAADATQDEERVLWADFALYQPDDILVKVDIATMAHGLEARAPLLDVKLVEWAMRLPFREKAWLHQRKRILKRVARRRLPAQVVDGPKRGFSVPIDEWFRGPLLPLLRETVLAPDARIREFVEPRAVEGLLDQHLARAWDWHHELWSLLWLELWCRQMLCEARPLVGHRVEVAPGRA